MQGNCPHCYAPLDLPASGIYQCEHCQATFEVSPGAPALSVSPPPTGFSPPGVHPGMAPPPPGGGQPEPLLEADAPCAGHPANPASRVCERCGDFMCRLCTTHVEGRVYCPRCFDLLYHRGALSFTQRQFTLPGFTLALGITSLLTSCLCVVGLATGIGGLIIGARAERQFQMQPELSGRQMNLIGMWLSGVGVFLGLAMTVLMGWLWFGRG